MVRFMRMYLILLSILAICISGCLKDANRVNPLDPKSDKYKGQGYISGYVTSYYPPHIGIMDVELKIIPCYQGAITNSEGFYQIHRIPCSQYTLIASKPGYAPDSTLIQVEIGVETSYDFKLDALPVLTNPKVNSGHISRWFPRPYDLFYIEFQVEVTDPDGANDISLVTVYSDELELNDTLSFSSETNFYYSMIETNIIDQNNPGALIGKQILFSAKDKPGNQNISLPIQLLQIIHDTPETISPAGLQTVNSTPQLIWKAMNPVFLYNYRIEINRTDIPIPMMVWSQENIAATDTTIIVSDSLETGKYYWTVTIVDEFDNFSRSKEAPFQIQ